VEGYFSASGSTNFTLDPGIHQYLVVTGATVAGTYFFHHGRRSGVEEVFPRRSEDAYNMAARFGRAIPATVLPLLIVTFTSRSGGKETAARSDQRILLSLYRGGN